VAHGSAEVLQKTFLEVTVLLPVVSTLGNDTDCIIPNVFIVMD
jgi:hypothetical protein